MIWKKINVHSSPLVRSTSCPMKIKPYKRADLISGLLASIRIEDWDQPKTDLICQKTLYPWTIQEGSSGKTSSQNFSIELGPWQVDAIGGGEDVGEGGARSAEGRLQVEQGP